MADPLTANTQLAVPIRGTDVGTWDVPVNGDFTLIDSMFGGVQSFALTNVNVGITIAQSQNSIIRLTGTLTGNVTLTLPSIYKFWTIDNQLTNSPSSFFATLSSTSGTNVIGLPPGPQDVFYDGTTVNYRNLGRIGEYWDYAAGTVPSWVTGCTKPPYLNCNGTAFSSATYPILTNLLGSAVLPDLRGVSRATLNQGTGRITTAGGGLDGNTIFSVGGAQNTTITSSHIPAHTHGITDPGHTHTSNANTGATTTGGGGFPAGLNNAATINAHVTGITINNSTYSNIPLITMPPTTIAGITMIRAA